MNTNTLDDLALAILDGELINAEFDALTGGRDPASLDASPYLQDDSTWHRLPALTPGQRQNDAMRAKHQREERRLNLPVIPAGAVQARRRLDVAIAGLGGKATPCAASAEWDADTWNGDTFEATEAATTRAAELACNRCPVLSECDGYAHADRGAVGVWGGKNRTHLRSKAQPTDRR